MVHVASVIPTSRSQGVINIETSALFTTTRQKVNVLSLYTYTTTLDLKMAAVEGALSFLQNIANNFLNCTICTERYEDAKCLPCLHNFCRRCLDRLIIGRIPESRFIKCPICRCKHQIPTGGIANLPSNFFVNELVGQFSDRDKKMAKSTACGGCDERVITVRCIECGIFLCAACGRTHQKIPQTKLHNLMSLGDYEMLMFTDPASVQPTMYCSKHPAQPLKFYCDTCEVSICLECTALDHQITEHSYQYLEDAAAEYAGELKRMVAGLKVKERETKTGKQAVKRMSQSLDNRIRVEERKLNLHMDKTIVEITRMIKENGKLLMQQLREEYEDRRQKLEAQHKELDIAENYLSNVVEFAKELIHAGNAAQMMSAKKGMTLQMKELMAIEVKCEPIDDHKIEFKRSEDFLKYKSLGVIVTTSYIHYELSDIPKVSSKCEKTQTTLRRHDKAGRKETQDVKKEALCDL
ncbi:E3 ubiquitin-protein ligase TRIM33-like [Glandiceps talaboti]